MVKVTLDLKDDAQIILEIAQVLKNHNKLPQYYEMRQVEYHYKELTPQPVFPDVELPPKEAPPTPHLPPPASIDEPAIEPHRPDLNPRVLRMKALLAKPSLTEKEIEELNELLPDE